MVVEHMHSTSVLTAPHVEAATSQSNVSLEDSGLTDWFASGMRGMLEPWSSMSAPQRANAIRDLVGRVLREGGVPEARIKTDPTGGHVKGRFDFYDWSMR